MSNSNDNTMSNSMSNSMSNHTSPIWGEKTMDNTVPTNVWNSTPSPFDSPMAIRCKLLHLRNAFNHEALPALIDSLDCLESRLTVDQEFYPEMPVGISVQYLLADDGILAVVKNHGLMEAMGW